MDYSSRAGRYLDQMAVWQKRTGQDMYAKPIYGDETEIAARIEKKSRLFKNSYGKDTVSEMTVYALMEIEPGDLLCGREVLSVLCCTKDGRAALYEALL